MNHPHFVACANGNNFSERTVVLRCAPQSVAWTYELREGHGGHPDLELAHAEHVEGEQRLRAPDADVRLRLAVAAGALTRAHHLSGRVQVHAGTEGGLTTIEWLTPWPVWLKWSNPNSWEYCLMVRIVWKPILNRK